MAVAVCLHGPYSVTSTAPIQILQMAPNQTTGNVLTHFPFAVQIKGKETYMAVTQHEPTDCRRTLPCFDEPALKVKHLIWGVGVQGPGFRVQG